MSIYWNNGYTQAEAFAALTSANPKWRFRVALRDTANQFLRFIQTVEKNNGDIDIDNTRDIIMQYTDAFIEPLDVIIDPFKHRFEPQAWLRMNAPSATGDGDPFLKFTQGLYLPSKFARRRLRSRRWVINFGGDDLTKILTYGSYKLVANTAGTLVPVGYSVLPLTPYPQAIRDLVIAARIPAADVSVAPSVGNIASAVGKQWDVGTPWVTILKQLATEANYEWFFSGSKFYARPWADYKSRNSDWAFIPDGHSTVYAEYDEDIGKGLETPNVVIGTVSRIEAGVTFSAIAYNNSQVSKYSVPNRGFQIPVNFQLTDTPDAPTFQIQVEKKLADISMSNKFATLRSLLVPIFEPFSVVTARTEDGAISLGEFETDNDFEGWTSANFSSIAVVDGVIRATTIANPQIMKNLLSTTGQTPDGLTYRYVKVTMRVYGGMENATVYFDTVDEPGFTPNKSATFKLKCDGAFHEYLVDMSKAVGFNKWLAGQIVNIWLFPVTGSGKRIEISNIRLIRAENKYMQTRVKYKLAPNSQMEHTLTPVIATD